MIITVLMELNMMSYLFALILQMHLVFVVIYDVQYCDLINTSFLAEYSHPKPSSYVSLKKNSAHYWGRH